MSKVLKKIQALVLLGKVRISEHGYDELAADYITVKDIIEGLNSAVVVEDYPEYPKGPCVLVLQKDSKDMPIQCSMGHS